MKRRNETCLAEKRVCVPLTMGGKSRGSRPPSCSRFLIQQVRPGIAIVEAVAGA
jgi:hypothetical protein